MERKNGERKNGERKNGERKNGESKSGENQNEGKKSEEEKNMNEKSIEDINRDKNRETRTEEQEKLEKALEELRRFVLKLAESAGESRERGEEIWQGIRQSGGLLQELAYYHDYGSFLSRYRVAGYTLSDTLVWQVDHFKLYMDRPEDMNRYRQERLLLSAFETMLELERDPQGVSARIRGETGQDIQPGM